MNDVHECVERVVSAGVKAYIGLLCCGEKERSRCVFSDTMQISSLASGGPSARLPVSLRQTGVGTAEDGRAEDGAASLARVLIFFTLRSLLASLLVLRVTAYWARVPALHDLQEACSLLNRCLGEGIPEAAQPAWISPTPRAETVRSSR